MRKREEIENDKEATDDDILLEVLLDCRALLQQLVAKTVRKVIAIKGPGELSPEDAAALTKAVKDVQRGE